jgi:signal transduction histidine kinase
VSAASDGALCVTADGRVTATTGSLRRVFGRDVAGASIDALFAGLDWASASAHGGAATAHLSDGGAPVALEIRRFAEGDFLVHVDAQGAALAPPSSAGDDAGRRAVAQRLAALERANDELARAARTKDELLAGMSHELRTPLHAVLGQAELLAEGIHGPVTDAQRHALEMIEAAGLRLLDLVTDLLDLAKIGAGTLVLAPVEVDLPALCREAIGAVRVDATRRSLRIALSEDGASEVVRADPARLLRVLVHVLDHAVRSATVGGRVGVELRGSPDRVRVVVQGGGAAPADDPARAGGSPRPATPARAELGLALAERLIELHGGALTVEGERVAVELPRHDPRSAGADPGASITRTG